MRLFLLATLAALSLWGCGLRYWSNGVRPTPRGRAAVLLEGRGGLWVPIACYDPDWVRLAGPADCPDLIPPGAEARRLEAGGALRLEGRRPAPCAAGLAAGFPAPDAEGLAIWPAGMAASLQAVDLDADGVPERIERTPKGVVVRVGGRRIGGCPPR